MAAFAKSWRKGVGHGKNGGRRSSVHGIEFILFCAATGSTTRQLESLRMRCSRWPFGDL